VSAEITDATISIN